MSSRKHVDENIEEILKFVREKPESLEDFFYWLLKKDEGTIMLLSVWIDEYLKKGGKK